MAHVDIFDTDVAALAERVVGRHVGEETVVEKFFFADAFGRSAPGHDCGVEHVAVERADDVAGHHFPDLQFDLRAFADEIRNETVQ